MAEPLQILLVEDDPDYQELIRAYLAQAGGGRCPFEVDAVTRLSAAELALADKPYDIVLLDLNLSDCRGVETLVRLRRADPTVPVVVLTNMDEEELGEAAIAEGAQEFLFKHQVDARRLRQAMRYAMERSRLLHEMERIIEAAPDGMVVVDRGGIVRYANAGAGLLAGREPRTWVGHPFDVPLQPGVTRELPIQVDGRERVLEVRVTPAHWRGEPAWLASLRDLTALRNLERLRAEVKERRRLDRLKDELVGTVSHELRTPLAVVHGIVTSLRDGLAGAMSPRQDELVDRAYRYVRRIERVTRKFLDLTRLESGRVRPEFAPLDVGPVLREVAEGHAAARRGSGPRLSVEVDPGLPRVAADADLVEQALDNLVDNALRHARSRVRVHAGAHASGGIRIAVEDDGPGIPAEERTAVFDKFVQVGRRSGGKGYKGTGLGLPICREIVALHGGTIWTSDVRGGGAGFYFTLPPRARRADAGAGGRDAARSG